MIYLILYLVVWLLSASIIAGLSFGHDRKKFSSLGAREQASFAVGFGLFMGLTGPIGILVTYLLTGFAEHGWMNPLSFKRR